VLDVKCRVIFSSAVAANHDAMRLTTKPAARNPSWPNVTVCTSQTQTGKNG
jgi:hypothetical protein